jgi:hypothetical protein
MNICLISREYPPETGWGGIGTYTYHLAHGLVNLGHQVYVITQSMDIDKEYRDDGVFIHKVAHKTFFYNKGILKEFALRLEYSQRVYIKIKELIKKYKLEIIEGPNLSGETFVYSLFKKVPLVTRLHTHFSEVIHFLGWKKTIDRHLSCWIENAVILKSDSLICSTKKHAEVVLGEIGVKAKNIEIIPLGVPLPAVTYPRDFHTDIPTVLFVGRLEKRKGVHVLIKAIPFVLEEIPEVIFNIVGRDVFVTSDDVSFVGKGDESFRARLIKSIPKNCQKNIHFLGYVDDNKLSEYYKYCDIFVAPSLYESFGFVYIEAMSYGKPVIGCGVGGVPEVIRDGETGILVPPEDPYFLAKAILNLLKDSTLRRRMGMNARKYVEDNFTREHMVEKTLTVYKKVLKIS